MELCLNFVADGTCHVDGRRCILGARGATARNEDHECELHGDFDVWVVGRNLLVTDLGFPAEEPVKCLALRINETVAMSVASEISKRDALPLTTSKRTCERCGAPYWMSQHVRKSSLNQNAPARFCPKCLDGVDHFEIDDRLGEQRGWCG
jgi:ribosomal protein S27AE